MDRTIRKAARRIAIDLAARRAAVGLLIGAGAGLGALLLDRLTGLAVPVAAYAAIVAAPMLLAIASALLRPPDPMETAVRLDRGLGLKDRMGTAEAVRQGMVSGEFAELARADAERTAIGLDVAAATPIRIGGPWPVGLALVALLAAAIAWVPPLRRAPDREATSEALDEQQAEIASAIDQAVASVDPGLLDETSQQDVEALEALAKQLAGGDPPPTGLSEARDESAATMEAVADRLDESAQRNLEALDELTRRVTSFEPPASAPALPPPPELAELLDKLRRGELEQAARQVEEASAQDQERSPEARRELAKGLDSLAEHLRRPEPEGQAQQEQHEQMEKVREALKDLGMDEPAAEQALQSQDRRALEEALARSGADPETVREMSRDLEELNQDRETREASDAMRERLAEALQDAAREIEGKDAAPHGEERPEEPQPRPGQQDQEGRPEERQQPGHDPEAQQRQVQPESPGPVSQQERQSSQQQDGQQEQQQRTQREGTQPDQQGRQEQGQQRTGEEEQQQQQQTGQDREQRQTQGRQGEDPTGRQSLPQTLRDLERVRREALGQRALSRELQETARRLADNLTEEERQRLTAQWMPSGGAPGSHPEGSSTAQGRAPGEEQLFQGREDVDLRDEDADPPERTVTRWLDPEGGPPDPGPGQAAPATGRAAAQRARTEAEQAVERAAVPSRYHRLIRRYFNKLTESAPPADPAGTPPPPGRRPGARKRRNAVNLRFDQPGMLLLGLPCIALAIASWWWLGPSMDALRRSAVIGLRTAVLLALVVMLAGPRTLREHHDLTVIGVLDISGSVKRLAQLPQVPDLNIHSNIDYLRHWFREATRTRAPNDRFGLVVFDGSATVVSVPGRGPYVDDNLDVGLGDGTDIAGGIRMALAMFPADSARRIVLASDGNETSGSVMEAAQQAAAGFLAAEPGTSPRLAVPIDVVPIEYRVAGDVQVVRLEAPPQAQPGQTVTLRVVLEATAPATGSLELRREGRALDLNGTAPGTSRRITVPAGRSVELAQVVLDESPVNRFQAAFEADDPAADALPVNNRAEAFTATPGRGAVLIVDARGEGQGNALASALDRGGIPTSVEPPYTIGADLLALQRYDLIVLDNVAAYELSAEQQGLLARYVHDLGGGLIMVGGEQGFGAGGWNGTALEALLPVELDPPKDLKLASAALVLVLDKSGSMNQPVAGTRASQQRIANEAAALAIESLRRESLVGVVSFDFFAHVEVELQRNDDPGRIAERVRAIPAEGGTNLAPALREAHRMLRACDAQRKLVVVLSDGRSQTAKLDEIVLAMSESGIRLTTIAVGDEADQDTLRRLAQKGGGEFYPVRNPRTLPRVLVDSVQVINKPLLKEVAFRPVLRATGGALGAALREAPELDGLVITTARPDPDAVVEATDPEGEPLLAHWQVGLGRVAAFTSDAGGRWSTRWLEWAGFDAFWAQLSRTIARPAVSPDAELLTSIENGQLKITLEASQSEGFLDYLQVDGVVYAPSGEPLPVSLRQVAPGRYQASVPAQAPGNYVVALGPRRGTRRLSPVIGGISQPESPEFRSVRSNPDLLEQVRQYTGGRMLDIERPETADLFDRSEIPPARSSMPAWRDLLWLALGLLLLDVAARRIAWDAGLLRRAMAAAARLSPHRGARGAEAATALASLRRTAPRERPAPPRAVEPIAPRSTAPPERSGVTAALDALLGRKESRPVPPEPPEPSAPREQPSPESPESVTGSLLAAKRRARKRM